MLGFNPYEYAIKIPAQAPPTMVSQIVNQHSAVEKLVKSVQTEQQKQQPKQETASGPSGLSDEEKEIFFNKRPRGDMDSAFGSSTPNVSEFRNPGEASGSRTSLRKNMDDLQQKLNMFDSKHKKVGNSAQSKLDIIAIATEWQGRNNDPALQILLNRPAVSHHYKQIYTYLKGKK